MTACKHVPAVGVVPTATSIPARLCFAVKEDESTRCYLAPHSIATKHTGYDQAKDATITWA